MSFETILKMIESVDPADTAKLDEIDARVFCYLSGRDPDVLFTAGSFAPEKQWHHLFYNSSFERLGGKHYTRSRDALKAIRPEGWLFRITQLSGVGHKFLAALFKSNADATQQFLIDGQVLPTEELAELHAIIQSIEYDRHKNDR